MMPVSEVISLREASRGGGLQALSGGREVSSRSSRVLVMQVGAQVRTGQAVPTGSRTLRQRDGQKM